MIDIKQYEPYYKTRDWDANQHYQDYAQRYAMTPKAIKWNWGAFWGGSAWLAYRKCYAPFTFIFCTEYILRSILAQFGISIPALAELGLALVWGFLGNNLYFWYMRRRIAACSPPEARSWPSLFGVLLIPALLVFVNAKLNPFPDRRFQAITLSPVMNFLAKIRHKPTHADHRSFS